MEVAFHLRMASRERRGPTLLGPFAYSGTDLRVFNIAHRATPQADPAVADNGAAAFVLWTAALLAVMAAGLVVSVVRK